MSKSIREGSPQFRYIMPGEPRSRQAGAVLQEQLKDPWDRPYIPGSSLKGALRTALVYTGWRQRKITFHPDQLNERGGAGFAGQPLERKVLHPRRFPGDKAPNYDLLRALQVGDSSPDEEKRLCVINVNVITGNKSGSPIELEAVPANVTFTATLTLDGYLLKNDYARQEMGWEDDQVRWVTNLIEHVKEWTQQRFELGANRERGKRWEGNFKNLSTLSKRLARNEFLLQLGWGGGWDSKTLGAVLTENEEAFAEVVRRYRQMYRQGSFQRGDRYPKSRRVIVDRKNNDEPVVSLGWIKVKMVEV